MQGIEVPCFAVMELDVDQSKEMNDNFTRAYSIDVRYHPSDDEQRKYEQCAKIGNVLCVVLANLQSIRTRAASVKYQIVDEVLHCFVTYNVKMAIPKDEPLQENYDGNVFTKQEGSV